VDGVDGLAAPPEGPRAQPAASSPIASGAAMRAHAGRFIMNFIS